MARGRARAADIAGLGADRRARGLPGWVSQPWNPAAGCSGGVVDSAAPQTHPPPKRSSGCSAQPLPSPAQFASLQTRASADPGQFPSASTPAQRSQRSVPCRTLAFPVYGPGLQDNVAAKSGGTGCCVAGGSARAADIAGLGADRRARGLPGWVVQPWNPAAGCSGGVVDSTAPHTLLNISEAVLTV